MDANEAAQKVRDIILGIEDCPDCVHAKGSRDVNLADPPEGYYNCELLGKEVWGEDGSSTCQDEKLLALIKKLMECERCHGTGFVFKHSEEHLMNQTRSCWSMGCGDEECPRCKGTGVRDV